MRKAAFSGVVHSMQRRQAAICRGKTWRMRLFPQNFLCFDYEYFDAIALQRQKKEPHSRSFLCGDVKLAAF